MAKAKEKKTSMAGLNSQDLMYMRMMLAQNNAPKLTAPPVTDIGSGINAGVANFANLLMAGQNRRQDQQMMADYAEQAQAQQAAQLAAQQAALQQQGQLLTDMGIDPRFAGSDASTINKMLELAGQNTQREVERGQKYGDALSEKWRLMETNVPAPQAELEAFNAQFSPRQSAYIQPQADLYGKLQTANTLGQMLPGGFDSLNTGQASPKAKTIAGALGINLFDQTGNEMAAAQTSEAKTDAYYKPYLSQSTLYKNAVDMANTAETTRGNQYQNDIQQIRNNAFNDYINGQLTLQELAPQLGAANVAQGGATSNLTGLASKDYIKNSGKIPDVIGYKPPNTDGQFNTAGLSGFLNQIAQPPAAATSFLNYGNATPEQQAQMAPQLRDQLMGFGQQALTSPGQFNPLDPANQARWAGQFGQTLLNGLTPGIEAGRRLFGF